MFVYVCIILGALQSYTWSLTYTVTTSGGSPPDGGSQLSCMRSSAPVHPTSSAHRMQVYPYRDEHRWVHHKRNSRTVPIILILWANVYFFSCSFSQLHGQLQLQQLHKPASSCHPEPISESAPWCRPPHPTALFFLPPFLCTGQLSTRTHSFTLNQLRYTNNIKSLSNIS